ALAARGMTRGERFGTLSANGAEFLAAYNGILRAGLVAVPVNSRFPAATIAFILRDAGARFLFCDRPRRQDCPADLPVVCFGGGAESFDAFLDPGPFEAVAPAADQAAMVLYTSGSTGTPKGALLRPRAQGASWGGRAPPWRPGSVAPPLSDRRAALSHERPGARPARLCGARDGRAAAAVFRARLHRGDRPFSHHLAHRGAADDRH